MTPRQIAAYCFLIARREDLEDYRELSLMILAEGGDQKQIEKYMKRIEKENT
jgi:hypothetical protein